MTPRLLPIARLLGRAIGPGVLLAQLGAAGCIDPQSDYDAFVGRPVTQREASVVDVMLTQCEDLLQQEPSGKYVMWCRPSQIPVPFAVVVDEKISATDGAAPKLEMTVTSLRSMAASVTDTVGPSTMLKETTLNSDCTYTNNVGTLTLAAEANSLMRDLMALDVVLRGKLQSSQRQCAELDGHVDDPIKIDLSADGDICIFLRAPADGAVPMVGDGEYACDPTMLPPR
jgi:hypothetical protein